MLFAPPVAVSYPVQSYPVPRQPAPYRPPASSTSSAPAPAWSQAAAGQSAGPLATVRAQMGEESPLRGQASLPPARRLALTIPAPEQLGIPLPRPVASDPIDWAAVHAQLDRLEVRCFHLEKRAGGGCRVTCLLPGTAQGAAHRIEALAASEPEAIRLTLAQAEAWSNSR